MLQKEEIIYEYEQILLGKRKKYISSFSGTDDQKKTAAGYILNYAITDILHWSPETAKANLTYKVLCDLCLDTVLKTIGITVSKLDPFTIMKILQVAFPDDAKYSLKRQTIDIYTQMLNLDGTGELKEYPKGFFSDEFALMRAAICLGYAISITLYDKTKRELYDFFASPESSRWLKRMKLAAGSKKMYDSPLEYFHYSLSMDQRDYIYFYNDSIKMECNARKKKAKKSA